jgi:hypothetical protein
MGNREERELYILTGRVMLGVISRPSRLWSARFHYFTARFSLEARFETYEPFISLTLSDPISVLVRHYDFPVPDAFLDL